MEKLVVDTAVWYRPVGTRKCYRGRVVGRPKEGGYTVLIKSKSRAARDYCEGLGGWITVVDRRELEVVDVASLIAELDSAA